MQLEPEGFEWTEADVATADRPKTSIALLPSIGEPAEIFKANGTLSLIEAVEAKARSEAKGIDISGELGRKALASLAYTVAKSKTAIDDAGKTLKKKMMEGVDVVDAERRRVNERLDALKAEIRKPLTDWENRDKVRIAAHEVAFARLSEMHADKPLTSEYAARQLDSLEPFRKRDWEEFAGRASKTLETIEFWLKKHHNELLIAEADAIELARHRKEAAERAQRERDERIATEAAEKARLAAEQKAAEQARRAEDARLVEERSRLAAEKRAVDAEAKAKADAERAEKARVEAAEKARKDRQAAVDAERRRAQEELEAIEAKRAKAAKEKAEVEAKRVANEAHRAKIDGEIRAALGETVEDDHEVDAILAAIKNGQIPHVAITY